MARKNITLAGRAFSIATPIGFGTLRRVPSALKMVFEIKARATEGRIDPAFLMDQMDVFTELVWDAINADALNANAPLMVIEKTDFLALLNGYDAFKAMTEIADAVRDVFSDLPDVPESNENAGTAGNVKRSESAS